jgi:predicted glycoside hydrolase/deacetylase ChbG (UPF0249 family)
MNALGRVAREFGITRVRNPVENLRDSWRTARREGSGVVKGMAASATVRAVSVRFSDIARCYNLQYPDHFLGLALTGQLGPAALCRLIDTAPDGTTEIMLHPGIADAELAATGSRLQQQRQVEMDGLLAPEVKGAVTEHDIELISYAGLN